MKAFLVRKKAIILIGVLAFIVCYSLQTGQLNFAAFIITCFVLEFMYEFYQEWKRFKQ